MSVFFFTRNVKDPFHYTVRVEKRQHTLKHNAVRLPGALLIRSLTWDLVIEENTSSEVRLGLDQYLSQKESSKVPTA